ncbi:DUF3459 domain-containing protein [Micromonospora sp. SL1-18]|uniref:DUF3459 domain-containing protein n=1 Tax=Micromonospora sp. SL1-18 TaxID=3399128 RepID=UPI003A4D84B2
MTEFTVWAPAAARVRLRLPGVADHDLRRGPDGWWRAEVPGTGPGTDYAFLLDDDERPLPDPRSPWQPAGVPGPSRRYDHAAFRWTDQGWTGRQLPGSVLYELHVGTFTPEGTFDAAIGHLDHLVDLGVDQVELLTVNAFDGEHSWGYDEVSWYAPHQPYGGPDGLKRLVDAAHTKGLGMILDVAYHHFGPAGAHPPIFAPYLSEQNNPWGRTVDLDGSHADGVRRHIIDSVLMWLRDYHVDGLRLDGVPAAPGSRLLHELTAAVESLSVQLGRPLSLIAEPDVNDPAHHALPTLFTGDRAAQPLSAGLLRVGATLLMTAPLTPMLFMGEEWAASAPWQFLTSRPEPDLVTAVAVGRRRQFAGHGWAAGEVPDRQDRQAIVRSRLDWAELDKPEHREMYDFYRRLIALRRSRPDLSDPRRSRNDVRHGDQFLLMRRGECLVVANLAGKPQRINLSGVVRRVLLATESGVTVMRDGIELPPESAAIVAL